VELHAATPAAPERRASQDRAGWWTLEWRAMGSAVTVLIWAPDLDAPHLLERARARLEELEQSWSRFRPESELSNLNRDPLERVVVSEELALILERSCRAWHATDGLFDPTVADAMVANGYGSSFDALRVVGSLRQSNFTQPASPGAGMSEVVVEAVDVGWVVARPVGLRFDFGGIGKGLAADLIAGFLVQAGAESACVSIGGDVRMMGEAPDGGWLMAVEHPTHLAPWFEAIAADGAIVASTIRIKQWHSSDGRSMHHVVDPTTGVPTTSGLDGAVVHAAEGWWAEALSTALIVGGPARAEALCDRHDVAAWMVTTTGESIVSSRRTQRSGSYS